MVNEDVYQPVLDAVKNVVSKWSVLDKTDKHQVKEYLTDIISVTVKALDLLENLTNEEKKAIATKIAIEEYDKAGFNIIPFDGQIIEHKLIKEIIDWLIDSICRIVKRKTNG